MRGRGYAHGVPSAAEGRPLAEVPARMEKGLSGIPSPGTPTT